MAMAWAGDAAPPDRIRDAATRAITLFQASQKGWHSNQTCNSCHHQYQAALAFQAAREHGIPVDEKIAHADAVPTFNYTELDRAVQYSWVIEPAMDDAYRLVAADAAGIRPNLVTAIYARLLAARQDADGSWSSFHQRPPSSYSFFTETALSLRAIQLYSHPSEKADAFVHVARGRKWLASHPPGDTEARTYQLLGLWWAGVERSELKKLAKALFAIQQPDGGWASLDGRDSDAYSTSQVLVALHDAGGVPLSDPRWQRGIQYLLNTQATDGSWHVVSRLHPPASVSPPYFETGYPYGHDQFLSALAADWAVMALARALGPGKTGAPPELKEGEPSLLEPWAETVLFRRHRPSEGAAGRRVRSEFGYQGRNHRADDGRAQCREDEIINRSRSERERACEHWVFGADGGGTIWRERDAGNEPAAGPWRGGAGCGWTACSHVPCDAVFPGGVLGQHRDPSAAARSRRRARRTDGVDWHVIGDGDQRRRPVGKRWPWCGSSWIWGSRRMRRNQAALRCWIERCSETRWRSRNC